MRKLRSTPTSKWLAIEDFNVTKREKDLIAYLRDENIVVLPTVSQVELKFSITVASAYANTYEFSIVRELTSLRFTTNKAYENLVGGNPKLNDLIVQIRKPSIDTINNLINPERIKYDDYRNIRAYLLYPSKSEIIHTLLADIDLHKEGIEKIFALDQLNHIEKLLYS